MEDFNITECREITNRILERERRDQERRSAYRGSDRRSEVTVFVNAIKTELELQAFAGVDLAHEHNGRMFHQINADALHMAITGNPKHVALIDFKPAPIVDSVHFQDVWGDAR